MNDGALETAQQSAFQRIRSHMRRREWLFWFKIIMMIGFGLPLSCLAPVLLATLLWIVALLCLQKWHLRWSWFFWPLAIIIVPLLYRLEFRTGGGYFSNAASLGHAHGPVPGPTPAGSTGAVGTATDTPWLSSAGFVEIFLFGPRLVVNAFGQARVALRLRADRHRAAAILQHLIPQTSGVDTPQLLLEGEQVGDIQPELAYLTFFQWIGIGEKWRHVWLYSAARQALLR